MVYRIRNTLLLRALRIFFWGVLTAFLCSVTETRRCIAGGAGAAPFNFLFLDADARAVGMGGAYTALARDANALLYNPAGLGRVEVSETVFMENRYIQGVSQEYLSFATKRGWGLSANHLNFGDIPRTTISNPNGQGSFGIRDLALGLGFGRALTSNLSMGFGLKLIRESIDDVSAMGYAADLGTLYSFPRVSGLSMAASIQNIGPSVRFQHAKENLPLNIRLGAAYERDLFSIPVTLAFDVSKERSESPLFFIGAEVVTARVMSVRAGFNTRNDAGSGVVFGIGWNRGRIRFDYAFTPLGELGASHRLSTGFKFQTPNAVAPVSTTENSDLDATSATPEDKTLQSSAIDEHFAKAERLVAKGALSEAKRELQKTEFLLDDNDPRSVRYFERLGRIFFLEGDAQFAQVVYRRAIERAMALKAGGDSIAEAYLGMGLSLLKQGKIEYAEKFVRKALETSPSKQTVPKIREALMTIEKKRSER